MLNTCGMMGLNQMELPAGMISVRLLSHIAFSQSERGVFIYMCWLLSLVLMQRRRLILGPAHLQHQRHARSGAEHTHTKPYKCWNICAHKCKVYNNIYCEFSTFLFFYKNTFYIIMTKYDTIISYTNYPI